MTRLALIGTAMMTLLAPCVAGDPPAPLTPVHIVGGEARSVVMNEEFIFIATAAGVQTIEVEEEGRPSQAGLLPLLEASTIAQSGDLLYVLCQTLPPTLHIVDASTAPDLVALSSVVLPVVVAGAGRSPLAVDDELAVVAFGNAGAGVIDVSDPLHPEYLTTFHVVSPGRIRAAALIDRTAVLFESYTTRAYVVDLSDPVSPQIRGSVSIDDAGVERAIVSDGLVYAQGTGRVLIMDPSNPEEPVLLSTVPAGMTDMTVDEGLLYVSSVDIHVYDVSDPAAPQEIGRSNFPAGDYTPHRLAALGERIAFLTRDATRLLRLSPDSAPEIVSSRLRTARITSLDADAARLMAQTRARVAKFDNVQLLGLPTSLSPTEIYNGDPLSNTETISLFRDQAVSGVRDKLFGYRLTNHIFAPVALGQLQLDPAVRIRRVEYNGKTAIVGFANAANAAELRVYGAATLTQNFPLLQVVTLPQPVIDFELAGVDLAVLTADGSIHMFDATNSPTLTSRGVLPQAVDATTMPVGLAREGDTGYILSKIARLTAVDLSDPDGPTLVGAGDIPGVTAFAGPDLEVRSGVAYFTTQALDGEVQALAVDASIGGSPAVLGSHSLPRLFGNSVVSANYSVALHPNGILFGSDGLFLFESVERPCAADLDRDGVVGWNDLQIALGSDIETFARISDVVARLGAPCE